MSQWGRSPKLRNLKNLIHKVINQEIAPDIWWWMINQITTIPSICCHDRKIGRSQFKFEYCGEKRTRHIREHTYSMWRIQLIRYKDTQSQRGRFCVTGIGIFIMKKIMFYLYGINPSNRKVDIHIETGHRCRPDALVIRNRMMYIDGLVKDCSISSVVSNGNIEVLH